LLDEYSFFYKEDDIVSTLSQKMWPMQIGNVIQEGNTEVQQQEENFLQRLEKEKDEFAVNLQ